MASHQRREIVNLYSRSDKWTPFTQDNNIDLSSQCTSDSLCGPFLVIDAILLLFCLSFRRTTFWVPIPVEKMDGHGHKIEQIQDRNKAHEEILERR